jgi:hypothetical protein
MPNKTEKIEFDSGDLTPQEYAKLKTEMEKFAEGLDCEVFDPEKEPSKKKVQPILINTNVSEDQI